MQYIHTKFLAPTNHKGARIKASSSSDGKSIIRSYDYSLDCEQSHGAVAMELARELDWSGEYAAGGNDTGYVFAFIGSSNLYSTEG